MALFLARGEPGFQASISESVAFRRCQRHRRRLDACSMIDLPVVTPQVQSLRHLWNAVGDLGRGFLAKSPFFHPSRHVFPRFTPGPIYVLPWRVYGRGENAAAGSGGTVEVM